MYKKNPAYDIIDATIEGQIKRVEKLVQKHQFLKQVADIRGHRIKMVDLFEEQEISTEMWTTSHFACYYGRVDILKHLIDNVGVA